MSKKPWLDGPSAKDRARAKIWQGGLVFGIGALATAFTALALNIVWFGTVIAAIVGLFWLLTGLITLATGAE